MSGLTGERRMKGGAALILIVIIIIIGGGIVIVDILESESDSNSRDSGLTGQAISSGSSAGSGSGTGYDTSGITCGLDGQYPCSDDSGRFCYTEYYDKGYDVCSDTPITVSEYDTGYTGSGSTDTGSDYGSDYYDTGYTDSGYTGTGESVSEGNEDCGYLNAPCCQAQDPDSAFGGLGYYQFCYEGLECRMDTCVEGPEYESATRPSY